MVSGAGPAARVVYNHFGGAVRFPRISAEMMDAVDWALRRPLILLALAGSAVALLPSTAASAATTWSR